MNAQELQAHLRDRYGKENDAVEWKAAGSLKSFVSGKVGEDLLTYVSAFANMEGGSVVLGLPTVMIGG